MLEAITLDQLRTFIAAASEGSFSAAGRKLNRSQSVISHTIASLEAQIGVKLFTRVARYPVLTEHGRTLLRTAQTITENMNTFKAVAKGLSDGLEAELSIVIDVMFPMSVLTQTIDRFRVAFPTIPLHISVEALGGVIQPLFDKTCHFGIMGSLPDKIAGLSTQYLLNSRVIFVAAANHPLAAYAGPLSCKQLNGHTQLVLTDRTKLSEGRQFGVFSSQIWSLTDIGAKHAFLLAGLGWGSLPFRMVENDIERGLLKQLELEDAPGEGFLMPMSAVYMADSPPGPAGRWFIEQLKKVETGKADPDNGLS